MSPEKRRPAGEVLLDIAQQYGAAGKRLARVVVRKLGGADLVWDTWEMLRNAQRFIRYVREARHAPAGAVVFIGSSSVVRFPVAELFAGGLAIGRGLGAETVADTIRRLRWTMPATRPSGVVVWAGANDLRSLAADPIVVVARVARLLDAIDAIFPRAPVALVGLPPWCDQTDNDLDRLRRLNEGLAALAFARSLAFVDLCRPPLINDDGRLAPAMADPDRKHLGLTGYEQVARWIVVEGGAAAAALSLAPAAGGGRAGAAAMGPPSP
jgi:lysophospholipase L1-like esterase